MKWCQPSQRTDHSDAPASITASKQNSTKMLDLQVKHQLFALGKLQLRPGEDHVVTCAWNGTTYLVDGHLNVAQFQFPERVCAFCCGEFRIVPGTPQVPCLIYVTFNDEIYVYYNIDVAAPRRPAARTFESDILPLLRRYQQHIPLDLNDINSRCCVDIFFCS